MICCKQFHLLKKRYEKLYNMILYDIIRYHNPDPPPRGSLGSTIFFIFCYLDFDVRSGSIYFIQKRFLVQVKPK